MKNLKEGLDEIIEDERRRIKEAEKEEDRQNYVDNYIHLLETRNDMETIINNNDNLMRNLVKECVITTIKYGLLAVTVIGAFRFDDGHIFTSTAGKTVMPSLFRKVTDVV